MKKKNKILYFLMFLFLIQSCAENIPEDKTQTHTSGVTYSENKNPKNENSVQESNQKVEKLKISSKCIGCWKCCMIDKAHFKADFDSGKAYVTSQENIESEKIQKAIEICPVDAISIS